MVSVLDRKLLRDLRRTVFLVLAITGIIATGVACFVSMRASYNNLVIARDSYYTQCRMADFWIDLKKAPLSEVALLGELPGVTEVQPRIQFFATVDLEASPSLLNALVLSMPDRRRETINDIVVRQGSYFTPTRANEVIVNEDFALRNSIRPGDWIHLLLNNRRQELFVVGTAISSEFVYMIGPGAIMPDPEHFGVFYLKHTYAEEVFDFHGAANQIVGRLAPQIRQRPDELFGRAERMLEPYGVFTKTARKDQPSNFFLVNEIEGLRTFAAIMPVIFLAVAALVLNVLMSRLTEQQRTVIGTLKALGYSHRDVLGHFLKFGLLVGLIGGVVGCAMGFALAEGMTSMYRQFYKFPSLPNRGYVDVYSVGIAISLVCAVVGSLNGARIVLRLKPAEAMRPKPPRRGGAVWLEGAGWLWQRLGFAWRLVLRAVIRQRLRTSVGVFAAAIGAALLTSGLMMVDSSLFMVEYEFEQLSRSDIDLTFEGERGYDALLEVERLPGVAHAEPLLGVACTMSNGPHSRDVAITGITENARLTVPHDDRHRPVTIPRYGLLITRALAERLHLGVGEEAVVRPTKGLQEERRAPVAAISDSYLGMAAYADIDYLSQLVGEEYAMTGVQLALDGDAASRRELDRTLKTMPAIQAVNDRAALLANMKATFLQNLWVFKAR